MKANTNETKNSTSMCSSYHWTTWTTSFLSNCHFNLPVPLRHKLQATTAGSSGRGFGVIRYYEQINHLLNECNSHKKYLQLQVYAIWLHRKTGKSWHLIHNMKRKNTKTNDTAQDVWHKQSTDVVWCSSSAAVNSCKVTVPGFVHEWTCRK